MLPWRRWWFRILLFVLLSVVLGAIHIYWERHQAADEVARVLAELDQSDPDWRLEKIEAKRQVMSDENNGALAVIAAHKALPKNWQNKLHDKLAKIAPPVQISSDLAGQLRTELQTVEPALIAARKLIDYPRGRFPMSYTPNFISTLVKNQQDAREIGSLLFLDAHLSIHQSQGDTAWRSARALLNVGRSLGDEPLLISQLIRFSMQSLTIQCLERALAHGRISESVLALMQQALAEEAAEDLFPVAMRGERAGNHQLCVNLETGSDPVTVALDNWFNPSRSGRSAGWWDHCTDIFARRMVYRSHAWLLRHQTEMIAAAELPGVSRYQSLENINGTAINFFAKEAGTRGTDYGVARLLVPGVVKAAYAEQRLDTLLHCTIAGLAAERFRLKNERWPNSRDELVQAKLPKEAPEDLYDGKPIRFRRAADGIVFYSVGKDGGAKGDALDRLEDFDPNRIRVEFRLWDPAHRRQPPLPPRKQEENPAP